MPISEAAAARGEPHILVPGADDALQAVGDGVQIAGDGKAATGAAIRQHGRRRHEPELRDIVIEPLGVRGVVGIGRGDANEEVLRSEEHTSELQSLMRTSYAVFCLKKKKLNKQTRIY